MTRLATPSHVVLPTEHPHTEEEPVLLSVVVPCFNEKNAVQATLRQLERELAAIEPHEIIAVDDGSTDGTSAILDSLAADITSLRVIRHILQPRLWWGA